MLKGNKKKTKSSLDVSKISKSPKRGIELNSDLTESAQNQKNSFQNEKGTFQSSEPLLDVQREYCKPEDAGLSLTDKHAKILSASKEYTRIQSKSIQVISREHLECSVCEVNVKSTDLYILSCYHTVCLGCVRIEEGYYKCPIDSCIAVASVQYGELRFDFIRVL